MDYQSAFKKMIDEHGLEVLDNSFLVRSFLLDMIGNSFNDNELLKCYFLLNQNEVIYHSIQYKNLRESKDYILPIILRSDSRYSKAQYIRSMEPILLYMFPNEYQLIDEIITNNKGRAIKHNNQTIYKPQVVVPQIINNAAKINKNNAKTKEIFNDIALNVECGKLEIVYGKGKKVRLIDSNNKNIRSSVPLYISGDVLSLNLKKKDKDFVLELPRKKYRNINIIFTGSYLELKSGDYYGKFRAVKINVASSKGNVDIYSDADAININQNDGYSLVYSNTVDLNINSTSYVHCSLSGNRQSTCNIQSTYGDIDLDFCGNHIYPKINHLFKRVNRIDGSYLLGTKYVYLNLKSNYGKIKVK